MTNTDNTGEVEVTSEVLKLAKELEKGGFFYKIVRDCGKWCAQHVTTDCEGNPKINLGHYYYYHTQCFDYKKHAKQYLRDASLRDASRQLEAERTKTMTNTDKLADCAKIMKNGWTLVNEQGDTVEIGDVLADFRGDKLQVTGQGRPPHKWGSTGRIELEGQEFFPGVVGCKWARSSDVMLYKVTQVVEYLDPNPVTTFFEQYWEASDFYENCVNDAVQWRVDHSPYSISEKELDEIREQERELVRLEEVSMAVDKTTENKWFALCSDGTLAVVGFYEDYEAAEAAADDLNYDVIWLVRGSDALQWADTINANT